MFLATFFSEKLHIKFIYISGPVLERNDMYAISQKKGKKGKIFENLGKIV